MEARGRARGAGRARGQPSRGQPRQAQTPAPPAVPGSSSQPKAWGSSTPPPPGMSAPWPRPPTQQQQQQPPTQQQQQATGQASYGRGSGVSSSSTVSGTVHEIGSGGDAESKRGRGTIRGGSGVVTYQRGKIIYTRPPNLTTKKGSSGKNIELETNYLKVTSTPDWGLIQYHVDFAPEIDFMGKKKALFRRGVKEVFVGGYIFDGAVVFTPQKLHNDPTEVFVQDEVDNTNYRITIKLTNTLEKGEYQYIQLFNLIMRRCLVLMGLKLVGRQYYDPKRRIVIEGIELWPGYYTSMRQHEYNILLNVDLSFKFMRQDNVYEILNQCRGDVKGEFQSAILGAIVLTMYNNKTYRVDDIDWKKTPLSKFQLKDGNSITFKEYYQKRYSVTIRYNEQPLLVTKAKKREIRAGGPETIMLIPELCQLTGLTDQQRQNFQLMRSIANHTRIGVEERATRLLQFAKDLGQRPECIEEVRRWDLSIAQQLLKLSGRVLPSERIISGQVNGKNLQEVVNEKSDWTMAIRSRPMFFLGKMEKMAVIAPKKILDFVDTLMRTLIETGSGMGFNLRNYRIFDINDDRSASYLAKIQEVSSVNPTLILTVVTNQSLDRYSTIKKACSVEKGIPSQVVVLKTIKNKGLRSICTKIAIQLNAKIGGCPWSVVMPISNLMIVGYDVCRDTSNKRKSFSGFVATMDKQMTRYFTRASEHTMEQELSTNFAVFLVSACQKYKELNNEYPSRIIIYRDGVGEGQLPYVVETEVESIKKALQTHIYKDEGSLKMGFIIVNKRINTKFFLGKRNPPPGCCVDDVVTLPEHYDFYMVSQCVNQGTVAPTYYNIIHDTLGLDADKIQILTYKLTHMYYNWSGTIRVPAPCQYAHKFAFLVAQCLHTGTHPNLELILHFL